MKVGDRVMDKLYFQDSPMWRGIGTVISLTPCDDFNCGCPGFAQIHWDSDEEPEEVGQNYADDVMVLK